MASTASTAHDIRKRAREALDKGTWQQIDLADRAGIDPSQLSRFLRRSDDRGLSPARLDALSLVLDGRPPSADHAPLPFEHARSLAQKLHDGRLALFAGAGLSHLAPHRTSRTRRLPLWLGLAARMAEAWGDRDAARIFPDPFDLFDHIQYGSSRERLEEVVRDTLDDRLHVPSFAHMLLRNLPWSCVLTTNYDSLLHQALSEKAVSREEDYARLHPTEVPRLFQLHGTLAHPHTLTRDDHRSWAGRHPRAIDHLRDRLRGHDILFVGHSVLDSHLADLFARLAQWTEGSTAYAWMWRAPEAQIALARRRDHLDAVLLRSEEEVESAFAQVHDELTKLGRST